MGKSKEALGGESRSISAPVVDRGVFVEASKVRNGLRRLPVKVMVHREMLIGG